MRRVQKNWLEWLVFAVSLALVLATVGYLIHDATVSEEAAADLAVRLGAPRAHSGHFAVPVTVVNRGGRTAEGAVVEVVLEQGGKQLEKAEFEIQFVPRRSSRKGVVLFESDPATGDRLVGRVLGYEEP